MLTPNFFNTVFVFPILNLLMVFYKFFQWIKIPGDFGFAIIGLTIVIRLILHPFFKQQLETAKKMQEIKPHLDRLSQKHKSNPKTLQQEQLKLYQQVGLNPASGCLFMIIQIPIFIALYQTLSLLLVESGVVKTISEINKVLYSPFLKITTLNPWFFGINLAITPNKGGQWYYYLIPLVTAVLQYLQTQVTMPSSTPASKPNSTSQVGKDKKEDSSGDFQKAMNMQMKYFFPLMIGWFSFNLPVGLALYWNIFSLFSIFQYKKTQNLKLKT